MSEEVFHALMAMSDSRHAICAATTGAVGREPSDQPSPATCSKLAVGGAGEIIMIFFIDEGNDVQSIMIKFCEQINVTTSRGIAAGAIASLKSIPKTISVDATPTKMASPHA